jgi:hypothetical protein
MVPLPSRMLAPVVVVLLWGTGLLIAPYSRHSRHEYQEQAQLLFRAALKGDVAVLHQGASQAVVSTLLAAANTQPTVLADWARGAQPYYDVVARDTAFVWFAVPAETCSNQPLALGFVREGRRLRVISLFDRCTGI